MDFLEYLSVQHKIVLNPQQKQAVLTIDGATLLLAVPGSGKTTVIITRLGNMIFNHQIPPEFILNISFSRASARDMKSRFIRLFGPDPDDRVEIRTIHSFCLKVLKECYGAENKVVPKLIEDNFSRIKKLYVEQTKKYIGDEIIKEIIQKISYSTNMLLSPAQIKVISVAGCDFKEIYKQYQEFKEKSGVIDFDDMLRIVYDLFKDRPDYLNRYQEQFRYINLDEAQDTSFLQHEIIRLLAQKYGNIFMVGDEDQSIYGFRAAFPKALLNFEKTYTNATVLKMERNYRSTKSIVNVANKFIKQNKERFDKDMFCENEEGIPINHLDLNDLSEQYSFIVNQIKNMSSDKNLAILYRNNDSAVPLVDTLERAGIHFSIRENTPTFFTHFVTNDILAYIRLAVDGSDIASFEKIYYKLNLGLSKKMLEFVKQNPKGNVFNTLVRFPGMEKTIISNIKSRQTDFENISRMKPLDALRSIETKLGYTSILKGLTKQGYSFETLMQKLNTLKNIAAKTFDNKSFLERIGKLQEIMETYGINESKVTLSTVHSSKGLEFDIVILIDAIDGQFPSSESIRLKDEEEDASLYEEETRLFYVGITRARKELITVSSGKFYGQQIKMSRFIDNLKPRVVQQQQTSYVQDTTGYKPYIRHTKDKATVEKEIRNYKVGTKICHNTFGVGVITSISGETAEIMFNKSGYKRLDLKMCVKAGIITIV